MCDNDGEGRSIFANGRTHSMIDTKLVLITGMSGSGKSSTAQNLARQFRLNKVRYRWMHEEIRRHPIREGEFTVAPRDSEENYQRNIDDMYQRWERLRDRILTSQSVYIMEGVLADNIIRYFFEGDYPREKILAYFDELFRRLAPARPVVVLLDRPDVRGTLESIYSLRGDWWKTLILSGTGNECYMANRGLAGDEGVYRMWEDYQELSREVLRRYTGTGIVVDTSAGLWQSYIERLTSALGLKYFPPVAIQVRRPEQYCGTYSVEVEGKPHSIEVCQEDGRLYVKSWWPVMPLLPLGGRRFEMASFPIKLFFRRDATGQVDSVDVSGIYDWEIVGTRMKKQ
jgi:hypothetical protein